MLATDPDSATIATVVSGAIIGVASAVGALFARSASRRSAKIHDEITVPSTPPSTDTHQPGATLKAIEEDLSDAKGTMSSLTQKVDRLTVSFARHEGAHEGLLRDIERIMRRVYKENGDG